MTALTAAIGPAAPAAAIAPPPSGHALAVAAQAAQAALESAQARVHQLQRALVLGMGDDEALDATILAHRAACVQALRWGLRVEPHRHPSPEERLAGWLLQAIQQPRRQPVG